MNNHINNEMLRIQNEYLSGKGFTDKLKGGALLHSYRDNAAENQMKKVRQAVAQMTAPEKLLTISQSVDRFNLDKYFNKFSTAITEVTQNYLEGVKQNNSGGVINAYNELVIYLRSFLNFKNLSETEKSNIDGKFIELFPQINEVMDIAIQENYKDKSQLETLYNNIQIKNYVPIKYLNYAAAIQEKKPEYETRRNVMKKIYGFLKSYDVDPKEKEKLEGKIELYEKYRNLYVQAKTKEKKEYYKSLLDKIYIESRDLVYSEEYIDVPSSAVVIGEDDDAGEAKEGEVIAAPSISPQKKNKPGILSRFFYGDLDEEEEPVAAPKPVVAKPKPVAAPKPVETTALMKQIADLEKKINTRQITITNQEANLRVLVEQNTQAKNTLKWYRDTERNIPPNSEARDTMKSDIEDIEKFIKKNENEQQYLNKKLTNNKLFVDNNQKDLDELRRTSGSGKRRKRNLRYKPNKSAYNPYKDDNININPLQYDISHFDVKRFNK